MKLEGLEGVSAYLVYIKVAHGLAFCHEFNAMHNDQLAIIAAIKAAQDEELFNLIGELNSDKFKKVHFSMPEIVIFFKSQSVGNKKRLLLEALSRISLSNDEVMRLLALHDDKHGISLGSHNIVNLGIDEIIPKVLDSLIACSEINCDDALLSESDKSALSGCRISILNEVSEILTNNPRLSLKNILPLAIKKALSIYQAFKGVKNAS